MLIEDLDDFKRKFISQKSKASFSAKTQIFEEKYFNNKNKF
jgi:hypothetical protein